MPAACHVNPGGSAGSSLIEVLVSLLLISISTLGLAALQINARALGHQAGQRTQAVILAGDLLERMRVNRDALSRYAVAGIGLASATEVGMPSVDCRRPGCSPVERSAWDLWQWQGILDGVSGGGLAEALACVRVQGRRVVVTISWRGAVHQVAPQGVAGCSDAHHGDANSPRQTLRLASYIGRDAA